MNTLKTVTMALCLSSSVALLLGSGVRAETTTPATDKPAVTTTGTAKMSEADKRAKATDCSRQADAKKLRGEARKSFREACKNK